MDAIDTQIAAAVRAELARARITGRDAAQLVGIDATTMSRRLNGHYSFTARELVILARTLDIPIMRLLGGD